MAETLILDSEALNVLARPKARGVNADRARGILLVAYERGALVRVPAPVLAEVYRGPRFDPALDHLLNGRGLSVVSLTSDIARVAGHLLSKRRLGSAHAVDALVVATAMAFGSAVIATGDPKDLKRLIGSNQRVSLHAV